MMINKWDAMKLTSFCIAKGNHRKEKSQPAECEKIFANDVTNKGITSKICEWLMQLNNKTKNLTKNWAEEIGISPKKKCK